MTLEEIVTALQAMPQDWGKQIQSAVQERMGAGWVQAFAATNGKEEEEEAQEIRLRQVGEFLREIGDPPPMLIEQMLPDMSLFLLTGKPKHCKSFMALDVADAIARNVSVFGDYRINRTGPVIYLAMEDGEFELSKRCVARGMTGDSAHPLYVCTDNFQISNPQSIAKLSAMIAPLKPVLIIIDTATEACGIKKWEDRAEVSAKLRPLRNEIARKICSVILVAHNRKADGDNGDEIAGTNGLTGAVDGWWSIYDKIALPNGNVQLFFHREGRGGVRGDSAVEMDTQTLQMHTLTGEEVAQSREHAKQQVIKAEQSARHKQVVQVIQNAGGKATTPQIARELEWDYGVTYKLVNDMLKMEMLEATGEKAQSSGGRKSPFYRVHPNFISFFSDSIESGRNKESSNPPLDLDKDFFNPPPQKPYKENDDDDGWEDAA